MEKIQVLVIGPNGHRAVALLDQLVRWGCALFFAEDCNSAVPLIKTKSFDLILSQLMLADGNADEFLAVLEGSGTDMFFTSNIRDADRAGWLQALVKGENFWLRPMLLSPEEFVEYLDKTLFEARLTKMEQKQPSGVRLAKPQTNSQ